MKKEIEYIFFGTGTIAARILEELEKEDLLPTVIVTSPDAPAGRKLELTPSAVKKWADARGIQTLQPDKLDAAFISSLLTFHCSLFVVADYGKILPQALLDIPPRGVINVHPSLLPRLRGPSPIRSAILSEKETGVTIMLVDAKMDHGPILAQKKIDIVWPPRASELEEVLAREGGRLLALVLPQWVAEEMEAREQNHDLATYCHFLKKEDGQLDLSNAHESFLKIRAFEGWPGTFAYFDRAGKKIRVQILDAHLEGEKLVIDRVKPEGKNEMDYAELVRSGATPFL